MALGPRRKTAIMLCMVFFPLVANAQDTPATAAVDNRVEVGKPAPDFSMTGIDGKSLKLSDKIGNKKHVVLMFSRAGW